jgi:Holliday junction resolvase RusA-like endonuclease
MTKSYVIEGDFTSLTRGRLYSGKLYDAWQQYTMLFGNGLESQHMGSRKFMGKVRVDAIFYIPLSGGISEKVRTEKCNSYASTKPNISALMRALEIVCTGILFEDAAIIVSMSATKVLSNMPRIEILITEIQNGKRTDEEKAP